MTLVLDIILKLARTLLLIALIVSLIGLADFGRRTLLAIWQDYQSIESEIAALDETTAANAERQAQLRAQLTGLREGQAALQRHADQAQARYDALGGVAGQLRDGADLSSLVRQTCRESDVDATECEELARRAGNARTPSAALQAADRWIARMCEPRPEQRWLFRQAHRVASWWVDCSEKRDALQAELARLRHGVEQLEEVTSRRNAARDALRRYSGAGAASEAELQSELTRLESEDALLARESARLERVAQTKARVREEWARFKTWVVKWALIAILVLASPWLLRAFKFFVLAPFVAKAKPVTLLDATAATAKGATSEKRDAADPDTSAADIGRQTTVTLRSGEVLHVRHDYVRSSAGGKSTLLYGGTSHPFTSYAAGLRTMTRFVGRENPRDNTITLASTATDGADRYLIKLSLKDHPGFTVFPSHIVAIAQHPGEDALRFAFTWRWRLVNWMSFRFRYLIVSGTGDIYLEGGGAITAQPVPETTQLEMRYYIGFDARMKEGIARNENAWAYLLSSDHDLFETRLIGERLYIWEKSPLTDKRTLLSRALDPILNAIGKFFGI